MSLAIILSQPVFLVTRAFVFANKGFTLPQEYHQELLAGMQKFEQLAQKNSISAVEVEHIKYALAAFIDEMVLQSNWPFRNEWMKNSLQMQLFGEHKAGINFFKRLLQIRQLANTNMIALEIYYLCLQFGFRGMYLLEKPEQLMHLKTDLYSQIKSIGGQLTESLSPEVKVRSKKPERSKLMWMSRTVFGVALLIIFGVYLTYDLIVDHKASQALYHINLNRDKLLR